MADVSLSYAPEDSAFAGRLASALSASGWVVSSAAVPNKAAGDDLAACVLVLWSHAATKSYWVSGEVIEALRHDRLVAVMVRGTVLIPPDYSGLHSVDLSDWDEGQPQQHPEFLRLNKLIAHKVRSAKAPTKATRKVRNTPSPGTPGPPTKKTAFPLLFLCYRREDTQDAADRLHERLERAYGESSVFMDIDSVPLGVDFTRYIEQQLEHCAAVLVLIGRNWIKASDEHGKRRLDDPNDHVRVEIATALRRGVPVIPVFVQDASMPKAKDLPEDLRQLSLQNGLEMPRRYWEAAVQELLEELRHLIVVS